MYFSMPRYCITDMDFKAPQKNTQKKSRVVEFSSEKAKCKPYKRGTCTIRKTPLYSKSMLVAPDGAILCTLDHKKADWYILKGIGMLKSSSLLDSSYWAEMSQQYVYRALKSYVSAKKYPSSPLPTFRKGQKRQINFPLPPPPPCNDS